MLNKTIKSDAYREYIARINSVQDYIESNLTGDLRLDQLAKVSRFSKFHFHKIFRAITGETLLSYINRIKMERALATLLSKTSMNITEIAIKFGYSETSAFSRQFKKYYGKSPMQLKEDYRKNGQVKRKDGQVISLHSIYNHHITTIDKRKDNTMMNTDVEVKTIDEISAIYLRYAGDYASFGLAFQKMLARLFNWAMARDILSKNSKPFTVYHDNPELTQPDHLRTSVCLVVEKDIKVEGDICKMVIPAAKYAIGHFELDDAQGHRQAWDYMYREWLPNSGFQPSDGQYFDMYMNDPNAHPEKKHFIDIYIPIKPL